MLAAMAHPVEAWSLCRKQCEIHRVGDRLRTCEAQPVRRPLHKEGILGPSPTSRFISVLLFPDSNVKLINRDWNLNARFKLL